MKGIFGATGSGKSWLMAERIVKDLEEGKKVLVICEPLDLQEKILSLASAGGVDIVRENITYFCCSIEKVALRVVSDSAREFDSIYVDVRISIDNLNELWKVEQDTRVPIVITVQTMRVMRGQTYKGITVQSIDKEEFYDTPTTTVLETYTVGYIKSLKDKVIAQKEEKQ